MVLSAAYVIVASSPYALNPDLLSFAVTIDVAVLVPLVYLGLARRFGWRLLSVVPVLVISLIAANTLIPTDHQRWLHGIELLLAPLELFLIGLLIFKVRAVRRGLREQGAGTDDFLEVLERVLMKVTDTDRPARIMATEVAMIHYGLTGWRKKPSDISGRKTFSYHRSNGHGTIIGVFLFLILVETAVLHWFLLPRVPWLAWLVFALSIYSCFFLLADLNAARLRPIFLEHGDLHVRVALRWRATIPRAAIVRAELNTLDIEDRDGLLAAQLAGNQDVILHLEGDHTADGLYGFRKSFNRLAISVDEVGAFVEAVNPEIEADTMQDGS